MKQLRGEYVDLACTKHGCFAIQKLWEVIGIKSREVDSIFHLFTIYILASDFFNKRR